jgi:hypothetical protein
MKSTEVFLFVIIALLAVNLIIKVNCDGEEDTAKGD